MNVWDVVLVIAIAALIVFAVWLMRRSRAKGGCACCPYAGDCEKKQPFGECGDDCHLQSGQSG